MIRQIQTTWNYMTWEWLELHEIDIECFRILFAYMWITFIIYNMKTWIYEFRDGDEWPEEDDVKTLMFVLRRHVSRTTAHHSTPHRTTQHHTAPLHTTPRNQRTRTLSEVEFRGSGLEICAGRILLDASRRGAAPPSGAMGSNEARPASTSHSLRRLWGIWAPLSRLFWSALPSPGGPVRGDSLQIRKPGVVWGRAVQGRAVQNHFLVSIFFSTWVSTSTTSHSRTHSEIRTPLRSLLLFPLSFPRRLLSFSGACLAFFSSKKHT